MDNTKVYLSYYDIIILLSEFEENRPETENFVTLLVGQFNDYFLEELEFNTSRGMQFNIPDIVLKNLKIYSMSVSLYEMILNLINIDLNDKKLRRYYKNYIKSYEKYISDSEVLGVYKKLLKKKEDN